jgi:hypothetical protein
MTASNDLRRRLARHYETEPPLRAPDWVLQSALSTIESTPQRRGLPALRRYPDLSTYTKLAAAAVVAIAVGGFALWQLGPGGPGGEPTPAPTPTAVPTAPPSPASTPSPAPTTYVLGALTQTFTSDIHGLSLMYPEDWAAKAATEPWTEADPPGEWEFNMPTRDKLYDAALQGNLALVVVSGPLAGASLDAWFAGFPRPECTLTTGGAIDGADRVLSLDCPEGAYGAVASSGDRGYFFELFVSSDDVELRTLDGEGLLDALLATVQLRPEDAVDE